MADLFARKSHKYVAQVQRSSDGMIVDVPIENYWTPEKDFILDAIANVAAAMTAYSTRDEKGRCIPHSGLSAIAVG